MVAPRTVLVFLAFAAVLSGQPPGGGRPRPPGPPGAERPGRPGRPDGPPPGAREEAWIAEVGRHLDPLERERRVREWESVVDGMTTEDRAAFRRLPPEEKLETIETLLAKRRADQEQAFLDGLAPETRSALEALAPRERALRLLELRIEQQFERALAEAEARGVLDAAGVREARAESAAEKRAAFVAQLQKRIFLHIHREEIEDLPAQVRAEIAGLAPAEFFRSPHVSELKARHLFTGERLMALKEAGESAIREVLEAIGGDDQSPVLARWLRPEALRELRGLDAEGRRRLSRTLRRTHFFRELGGETSPRGREDGERERSFVLPGGLWRQLSPAEQATFFRMARGAQARFIERRFPQWAATHPLRGGGGPLTVQQFLDAWQKLPETDRARLALRPLRDVVRELGLGPEGGDEGPRRPGAEARGFPGMPALVERLSVEDRKTFEALDSGRARMEFLRARFPGEVPDEPGRGRPPPPSSEGGVRPPR